MHICFIGELPTRENSTGGIGSFLATLASELVQRQIKVSIITFQYRLSETILPEGIDVHRISFPHRIPFIRSAVKSLQLNKSIRRIHARYPIDVLECQEGGLAYIKKINHIFYMIRLHGGHRFFCHTTDQSLNTKKAWVEARSIKKADGIIGVTQFAFDITAGYYDFTGKQQAVIQYPVDTNTFCPAVQMNQTPAAVPLIVYAGTLVKKKGVSELLKAAALLHQRGMIFRLELYGRDWINEQGDSFQEILKQQVQEDGIVDMVGFMGPVHRSQLLKKYQTATVCVFPSHSETQGIVVLEAMSVGKPVVFGKCGPSAETIDHGKDGMLVNGKDPADIAEALGYILLHPEKAEAMGRAARKKMESHYAVPVITERNIRFYRDVTGKAD